MDWAKVGKVTHYFDRISVAVVELYDTLALGSWVGFVKDEQLLFEQEVTSMQVEHQSIQFAQAGDEVALKVNQKVKQGTEVYKLLQ